MLSFLCLRYEIRKTKQKLAHVTLWELADAYDGRSKGRGYIRTHTLRPQNAFISSKYAESLLMFKKLIL